MNCPRLHMTDVAGGPIWDLKAFLVADRAPQFPTPAKPSTTSNTPLDVNVRDHIAFDDPSRHQRILADGKGTRPSTISRKIDIWRKPPTTFSNPHDINVYAESVEQLKMLYDKRMAIFDDCIDVYKRESMRKDFCWFDWKPLISKIGEPAILLWKSIIVDEMHTKERITLPIDDPEMLKHLCSAELDHLSKLYIVRLDTAYKSLDKLLKGKYANVISDFERESIARMPQIIPQMMHALSQINPQLDAVLKYYGRIAEYKKKLDFIKVQSR